jgi:hypothetical protein
LALEHGAWPFENIAGSATCVGGFGEGKLEQRHLTAAQTLVLWHVAHPQQPKPKPLARKMSREALKELARKSDPSVQVAWETDG